MKLVLVKGRALKALALGVRAILRVYGQRQAKDRKSASVEQTLNINGKLLDGMAESVSMLQSLMTSSSRQLARRNRLRSYKLFGPGPPNKNLEDYSVLLLLVATPCSVTKLESHKAPTHNGETAHLVVAKAALQKLVLQPIYPYKLICVCGTLGITGNPLIFISRGPCASWPTKTARQGGVNVPAVVNLLISCCGPLVCFMVVHVPDVVQGCLGLQVCRFACVLWASKPGARAFTY